MMRKNGFILLVMLFAGLISVSCNSQRRIAQSAEKFLLHDADLSAGHIGICLFDPSSNQYLYQHQANKNFIPASNGKILTLYAALTYLPRLLPAATYRYAHDSLLIYPTGDPSFLNPKFSAQPFYDWLRKQKNVFIVQPDSLNLYAPGWAWDDYQDAYMAERSAFPIYGNLARIYGDKTTIHIQPGNLPLTVRHQENRTNDVVTLRRNWQFNDIEVLLDTNRYTEPFRKNIPFHNNSTTLQYLLADTLKIPVTILEQYPNPPAALDSFFGIPLDSALLPMMHNSDNFIAEQLLLMAALKKTGSMQITGLMDSLLKDDFAGLPQKPIWVDGSGLSRYNLISPASLVALLHLLQKKYGLERMKKLFPHGGEGTLKGYFLSDNDYVYAKTGSMAHITTCSGYFFSKKGRLIVFSILLNHYPGGNKKARIALESFIQAVSKKY